VRYAVNSATYRAVTLQNGRWQIWNLAIVRGKEYLLPKPRPKSDDSDAKGVSLRNRLDNEIQAGTPASAVQMDRYSQFAKLRAIESGAASILAAL